MGWWGFYAEFGSIESVESVFWEDLFTKTLTAVQSGAEWEGFGARQRMLAFLYAFLEKSLDVRTVLLFRFRNLSPLSTPEWLRGMERRFKEWASELVAAGSSSGEIAARGRVASLYPTAMYRVLRSAIRCHAKDTSARYQRSEPLVDKSNTPAFCVM